MDIESNLLVLLLPYFVINAFAFFLMLDDKQRSRKSESRISEGNLFFSAICFGALGIWAGMFIARHKTQKITFILGVPLALLQNALTLYLFYDWFGR